MDLTIPLDADLSAFVASQVESGRFSSTGEVIREALHLFRSINGEGAFTSDELRTAWQEGLDSGDAGEVDIEEIKKDGRALLGR